MLVRAKDKNRPVPMERRFPQPDENGRNANAIYDTAVEVENSEYYRKQIRNGDLEEVTAPAPTTKPKGKE